MTPRERNLVLAVGGLVLLLVLNFGVRRILDSISSKEARVDAALSELTSLDNAILLGTRASAMIGKLSGKSLPSDREDAVAQYSSWLSDLAGRSGMTNIGTTTRQTISQLPSGYPLGTPKVYDMHEFTLGGQCTIEQLLSLLSEYYNRDYLHQISSLKVEPILGKPSLFTVNMTSRALSLAKAPPKKQPSKEPSGRLAMSAEGYKLEILERSPFSPPNRPPVFRTQAKHDVPIGKSWDLNLAADDPDGNGVTFELVSKKEELPESLTFKGSQLSWKPTEKGEQKVVVRATDNGWPHKSVEMTIALNAVEPTAPDKPKATPTVDPAQQAFLTGLVTGRNGAQGWIRSRTEGQSIDIYEGAEIKIGSIAAKVIRINVKEDYVELESDGIRWTMDMNTSLAEAFKSGQEL